MGSAYAIHGPWAQACGHRLGGRAALGAFLAMAGARRHGGHRGGGPWGGWGREFPFGGPPMGGPPFGRGGWGRGRKAKRGDVRASILALLSEEPRNGYQIIQAVAERSEGAWRPSPGAVYPALQQLTDEGLVRSEEADGRRTFHLTDAGRAYVADHEDEMRLPWEAMTPQVDEGVYGMFDLAKQAGAALFQVAHSGSDSQVAKAREVLEETRRKLYQILAEGDPGDEA